MSFKLKISKNQPKYNSSNVIPMTKEEVLDLFFYRELKLNKRPQNKTKVNHGKR